MKRNFNEYKEEYDALISTANVNISYIMNIAKSKIEYLIRAHKIITMKDRELYFSLLSEKYEDKLSEAFYAYEKSKDKFREICSKYKPKEYHNLMGIKLFDTGKIITDLENDNIYYIIKYNIELDCCERIIKVTIKDKKRINILCLDD